MKDECGFCDGKLKFLDNVYSECESCGIHIKRESSSKEITNDLLDKSEIIKLDRLSKFKLKVAKNVDPIHSGLLDVGAASGKFLFHSKTEFDQVYGIEINPKCIVFASTELDINLYPSIDEIDFSKVSCVTFWHSLEHIPCEKIIEMLIKMKTNRKPIPVVVSVPNCKSFQFQIFKEKWPYYDKESHLYQFSPGGLDSFMKTQQYEKVEARIGILYEFFGYLQGFVNFLHPIPNYFYYRKKRGWNFGLTKWKLVFLDTLNIFLLLIFAPVSLLSMPLSLIEGRRGVINHVYVFRN